MKHRKYRSKNKMINQMSMKTNFNKRYLFLIIYLKNNIDNNSS